MSSGIAQAGVSAQRGIYTTFMTIDDASFPVMNVAHTAPGGSISLSAGTNYAQGFSVQPTPVGNSQIFVGPNSVISNVFTNPGTAYLGTANVGTALNVVGPTSLTGNVQVSGNTTITGNTTVTGSFLTTGSTTVGNTLFVANTVNTPILHSNLVTTSAVTATGALANAFIDTATASTSSTAALYLSATCRLKVLSNGGLATQFLFNGSWYNGAVTQPTGFVGSVASLLSITT